MSQNYSRGLENEYLVPYLEFTESPSTGSIAGGGTTSLTAVATAVRVVVPPPASTEPVGLVVNSR